MSRIGNFAGTVLSAFKIGRSSVDASGLSAARTHALPDASGTLALEAALTATVVLGGITVSPGSYKLVALTSTGLRTADRSVANGACDGFVVQSYAGAATATYFTRGTLPGSSGYTVGDRAYLGLAGAVADSTAVTAGQILQGVATATTGGTLFFDLSFCPPILLGA